MPKDDFGQYRKLSDSTLPNGRIDDEYMTVEQIAEEINLPPRTAARANGKRIR